MSTVFTLLGDQPSVSDHDQLGYDETARQLADMIVQSRESTPLTIGIEGEWGSGKSTLMGCLNDHLAADPSVRTIWFNAWTAEGRSALEGLIKSVLHQLDPSVLRRALHKTKLLGFIRVLALSVLSLLGAQRVIDIVWERANADARTRNELRRLVTEAMGSWADKKRGESNAPGVGRLLVVFIDDLDRASATQVFEVFEAIKVYLDVPGFVFVIGYDRVATAHTIATHTGNGPAKERGREYLEKIVQTSYSLPAPSDAQAQRLLQHYTSKSNTESLFGDVEQALVVERNQRNPRRMKRFINTFVLSYRLDDGWQGIGAKALIEVLLLEMYFPDFSIMFRRRAKPDPITEFLEYRDKRQALLESSDLAEESADEAVAELERQKPEQYPLLVRDEEFVALLESMHGAPSWFAVLSKLERRSEESRGAVVQLEGDATERAEAAAPTAAGTLLWIDDKPANNQRLVDNLKARGWAVTQVEDGASAMYLLRHRRFDAVISDVGRRGDNDIGIDDMETIRSEELHKDTVIFFTLRITPELRERAVRLGATLTNKVEELLTALEGGLGR